MFRVLIILSSFLLASSVGAVNPDFYRQQKIKKEMRAKRAKGAKSFTKGRLRRLKNNSKKATAYTKKRRQILKDRQRREKLFTQDSEKKLKFKNRKLKQAEKEAKRRRKKTSTTWEEENVEYGIGRPGRD